MKHPDTFQWESRDVLLLQAVFWDISGLVLTLLSRTLPSDTKKLQGNDNCEATESSCCKLPDVSQLKTWSC